MSEVYDCSGLCTDAIITIFTFMEPRDQVNFACANSDFCIIFDNHMCNISAAQFVSILTNDKYYFALENIVVNCLAADNIRPTLVGDLSADHNTVLVKLIEMSEVGMARLVLRDSKVREAATDGSIHRACLFNNNLTLFMETMETIPINQPSKRLCMIVSYSKDPYDALFYEACIGGRPYFIDYMMLHHVDKIDVARNHNYPLTLTFVYNQVEAAQTLLDFATMRHDDPRWHARYALITPVDPGHISLNRPSCMYYACSHGNRRLLDLLLSYECHFPTLRQDLCRLYTVPRTSIFNSATCMTAALSKGDTDFITHVHTLCLQQCKKVRDTGISMTTLTHRCHTVAQRADPSNRATLVKFLMECLHIMPSVQDLVCGIRGSADVAMVYLGEPNIPRAHLQEVALYYSRHGPLEALDRLLMRPDVGPAHNHCECVHAAIESYAEDRLQLLLTDPHRDKRFHPSPRAESASITALLAVTALNDKFADARKRATREQLRRSDDPDEWWLDGLDD